MLNLLYQISIAITLFDEFNPKPNSIRSRQINRKKTITTQSLFNATQLPESIRQYEKCIQDTGLQGAIIYIYILYIYI